MEDINIFYYITFIMPQSNDILPCDIRIMKLIVLRKKLLR